MDATLKELAHQPFGSWLLGILALGLVAYGVYSFVEARSWSIGREHRQMLNSGCFEKGVVHFFRRCKSYVPASA
jgi:hypothetical protein